ncbi:Phosphatidylserine/phosphatidylglycerophosphate/cardiolipin synthase [Paracoccus tibetensis]|uniref:Phospholipase D n=2 Tax=Paracoccus tibetensis TaxID=336292 RepID=A0A1G5CY62_9RHOB|nr:Phosphatidylserine/phosphatidylglycerophosphate/cardiolipin synthase [Paracoccus tibetensis]
MALLLLLLLVAGGLLALRLTHPLPIRDGLAASMAIPASTDTRLGSAVIPMIERHPGLSGVAPLADGRDALAMRVLLARAAERSLDVQYYIWQTDTTGWLLLDEVRAAADRGVRVRLLLDDNGIPGLDEVLAALHAHPGIEVRIFNPFTLRRPKLLSYGFDFPRLNRRMHNKSMTADGVATILGGRNIGDIYFAYGSGVAYFDLDVLGVGPIARDVSTDFDGYWSSASSYPADLILPPATTGTEALARAAETARQSVLGSEYLAAIAAAPLLQSLMAGEDILEWTDAVLVSDDPAKGLGRATQQNLLIGKLADLVTEVEQQIDVVSAYLIPGRTGSALFRDLAAEGRQVRLVTNSLEATDVPIVHAAWMNYRERLVREGVQVQELRAQPGQGQGDVDFSLARILTGSSSSLHAKTFAIDGTRIFIGSFNLDPRSAALNTEMGVLVASPSIAESLGRALDDPRLFYEVGATPEGRIEWRETGPAGEQIVHRQEPNASLGRRLFVWVGSWLPVEWML